MENRPMLEVEVQQCSGPGRETKAHHLVGARIEIEAQQQKSLSMRRQLAKPSSSNLWNHSLVLSKRLWPTNPSSQNNSKRKGSTNKALAQRALEAFNSLPTIQRDADLVTSNQVNTVLSSVLATNNASSSAETVEQGRQRGRPALETINNENEEINAREQSHAEYPPGFEPIFNSQQSTYFNKLLEEASGELKTKEDVKNWVRHTMSLMANFMGMTSNMGNQAVEQFFFEMAMHNLKGKMVVTLSPDEQEIQNYKNSKRQCDLMSKIVTWNAKGLCNGASQASILTLINYPKVDMVLIQDENSS
ncbi:hypothetical protein FRX31_022892 [Thalictrum thalictroides]|uniref:Uncharacterized protein n=1 Tax=Thalictrum thalictroides TaxID=46969 RepID=A0A7J6VRZ4_THATH|nr:hypothetical protein FRX31_022892 [Thalictrum thalictroides]